MEGSGVAAWLRQWASVKTVKKITIISYLVSQVTVLRVFYDNFAGSFLIFFPIKALRTRLRLLVQSNPRGVHQT